MCFLFGPLKKQLEETHFQNEEEVINAVTEYFDGKCAVYFRNGIIKLLHRWKDLYGEYLENRKICLIYCSNILNLNIHFLLHDTFLYFTYKTTRVYYTLETFDFDFKYPKSILYVLRECLPFFFTYTQKINIKDNILKEMSVSLKKSHTFVFTVYTNL